jgi:hypothetical protein
VVKPDRDNLSVCYTVTQRWVASIITVVAILVVAAHVFWKDLIPLDKGTLILLGIAVLPWLPLFFKKFKFKDFEVEMPTLEEKKQEGEKVAKIEPLIMNALQKLISDDVVQQLSIASEPSEVLNLLKRQIKKVENDVLSKEFISVDLTQFEFGIKKYPMTAITNMDDLLNTV